VSNNRKSNRIAGNFLIEFSKNIQKLDPRIKAFDSPKLSSTERKLLSYVISTKQSTDDINNREIRHNYLLSILKGGFILKKDAKRIFDQNVKDLLWTEITQNKKKKPKCPNPLKNKKCKKYLTYDDAQVDHKHPWNKGGKTTLNNAQLICSSCNSSKGGK
jgi:5-methylcytosine-specific restriction endonuclease McrA